MASMDLELATSPNDILYTDDAEVVPKHLLSGANPNTISKFNNGSKRTPLVFAIAEKYMNVIDITRTFLEDSRTNVNAKDSWGDSALTGAAWYLPDDIAVEVTKILLADPRVNVKSSDTCRYSAVYCAAKKGRHCNHSIGNI